MSSEKKQPVKIVLSELKEKVQNGAKRKALAEYYGISEVQMAKALKSAGLKIRNFHAPAFEIVEDLTENKAPEIQAVPFEEAGQIQMLQDIAEEEEEEAQEDPIPQVENFGLIEEEEERASSHIPNNPLNY